jgi:hypothetical protein
MNPKKNPKQAPSAGRRPLPRDMLEPHQATRLWTTTGKMNAATTSGIMLEPHQLTRMMMTTKKMNAASTSDIMLYSVKEKKRGV